MPPALAPHRTSTPPSSTHSATECSSETATHTSMAAELQDLLSKVVLNTSSPASGHSTPRRSASVVLGAPPLIGAGDLLALERADSAAPEPMATSSQASL